MMRTAMLVLALAVCGEAASMSLRRMRSKVREVAEFQAESKAAAQFFRETLGDVPKNGTKKMTKEKENMVLKVLESEVTKLDANAKQLKAIGREEKARKGKNQEFMKTMKGKDAEMMKKFDEWSERSNRKAEIGALDVMSKLKNAIHLIKKGALTGENKDAQNRLNDVLQSMGQMVR
eukprot:gnl/TRDRNA2_/TRDRNA2_182261_c0_seq1.p1 gnl/TRDRNA2_/TRDRNA2_182261_c0~~gnl/TRDRNA2_/TRDRNA2_182261_c0_seq1.p1  ORF type:complete len:177 (+),score=69.46 gnl/TRDRNA2_/TRDRNA2_182261_c0_seq1:76-606(+)